MRVQKSILSAAWAAGGAITNAELIRKCFGATGPGRKLASAQASLARARKTLAQAGLVTIDVHTITLTGAGWDEANEIEFQKYQLRHTQPNPLEPMATKDADPEAQLIASMTRVRERRHSHRASGGERVRKPLIDISTGGNIEFQYLK